MRKVERSELLDYETYSKRRDELRSQVMAIKAARRVHVGDYLTFLFENTETIRYQIQEMMRAERIVREADIQHELDTYNALLGETGQLGCTLLIEIDDAAERDRLLRTWRDLPAYIYLRTADGRTIRPTFDSAQIGDKKLSSVQYLKFTVGTSSPHALGSDHPALTVENVLTEAQRNALLSDLAS